MNTLAMRLIGIRAWREATGPVSPTPALGAFEVNLGAAPAYGRSCNGGVTPILSTHFAQ